jgi:hypothetical protein
MPDEITRRNYQSKARVRTKVEHSSRVRKRAFEFVGVRLMGLEKNPDLQWGDLALLNLGPHRKHLAQWMRRKPGKP